MAERRRRGLLDTSAVVDIDRATEASLPIDVAVSMLSVVELEAGLVSAPSTSLLERRIAVLERVRSTFVVMPFDDPAARAFAKVFEATRGAGRSARGARVLDLLIAATALAADLPLYTRTVADVEHLREVLDVVAVELAD